MQWEDTIRSLNREFVVQEKGISSSPLRTTQRQFRRTTLHRNKQRWPRKYTTIHIQSAVPRGAFTKTWAQKLHIKSKTKPKTQHLHCAIHWNRNTLNIDTALYFHDKKTDAVKNSILLESKNTPTQTKRYKINLVSTVLLLGYAIADAEVKSVSLGISACEMRLPISAWCPTITSRMWQLYHSVSDVPCNVADQTLHTACNQMFSSFFLFFLFHKKD